MIGIGRFELVLLRAFLTRRPPLDTLLYVKQPYIYQSTLAELGLVILIIHHPTHSCRSTDQTRNHHLPPACSLKSPRPLVTVYTRTRS